MGRFYSICINGIVCLQTKFDSCCIVFLFRVLWWINKVNLDVSHCIWRFWRGKVCFTFYTSIDVSSCEWRQNSCKLLTFCSWNDVFVPLSLFSPRCEKAISFTCNHKLVKLFNFNKIFPYKNFHHLHDFTVFPRKPRRAKTFPRIVLDIW